MRHITRNGLNFIKGFEQFRPNAYICPAGILTIGYGHTGNDVKRDMYINLQEAEELLARDVSIVERSVLRLVNRPLTDNQFDALVSFTFNVGSGAFQRSTLRQKVNRYEDKNVPLEMARWNKSNGRIFKGLTNRRIAEGELWSL